MPYISPDGIEYKDYQEYCNSDDLELDDKFRKLLVGARTPQNDKEQSWLDEMRRIQEEGRVVYIPSVEI